VMLADTASVASFSLVNAVLGDWLYRSLVSRMLGAP